MVDEQDDEPIDEGVRGAALQLALLTEGNWTIREFCEIYKVGETSLYEMLNSGELAAIKARGRTLIPKSEARAWLKRQPSYLSATKGRSKDTDAQT